MITILCCIAIVIYFFVHSVWVAIRNKTTYIISSQKSGTGLEYHVSVKGQGWTYYTEPGYTKFVRHLPSYGIQKEVIGFEINVELPMNKRNPAQTIKRFNKLLVLK